MKGLTLVVVLSCSSLMRLFSQEVILVSKDPSRSYTTWLMSLDSTLKVREFYTLPSDSMKHYLDLADGMVLTGGEDVNPTLYGKPDYIDQCEAPDNFRDSIEKLMIEHGFDHGRPLLGICRGQQIINALSGGNLIPDIPTRLPQSKVPHRSKQDSAHQVLPSEGSWLYEFTNGETQWVNSRHHQAVDKLAPGFKVAAIAPDGIVESIEYLDNNQHVFIVGVQWHPENLRNELSTYLGELFLDAASGGTKKAGMQDETD
ncbi:MAG: gamma-glutamyl-gamma-aminobutyrate hydrolase family protein [Vicingaceae bacterium]